MKIIGIYPGSFQPATRAHLHTYKKLKSISSSDTFIVTTDKNPTPDAPLNFGDKEQIWVRYGVPAGHIVKIQDWKNPIEVLENFSESHTNVIFALSSKDAAEFSRKNSKSNEGKEIWVDSDGNPGKFQPYKGNEGTMLPCKIHFYVIIVDDTQIEGKSVSTANIRQTLGSKRYNDDQKKTFFRFVFGWFDIGLYSLIKSKFALAQQASSENDKSSKNNEIPSLNSDLDSQLRGLVREVLKEIMDEDYGSMNASLMVSGNADMETNANNTNTSTSQASVQQKSDVAATKAQLVQSKKELEAKAKQNKQQRDNYSTTVNNYDTFQKKADRDNLDVVNKQLSQSNPSITN